ncbi:hypothetical protein [Legionella nagasakiensis]|uniref:hypothetical protein n=1 Tax=Legionella nagasakiensis TaxID=535290 RepID=UPI00105544A7|nr:hypothetical protein [Legionella nagasakiensis]
MANRPNNVVMVVVIVVIVLLAAIILHHIFGGPRPVIVPVKPLEPETETRVELPPVIGTQPGQPANTTGVGARQNSEAGKSQPSR